MTKDKKGRQYYVSQETHNQLIAIGRAHGAAEGREASPGIRVAARYHGRLVEMLEAVTSNLEVARMTMPDEVSSMAFDSIQEARLLLREIEVAG